MNVENLHDAIGMLPGDLVDEVDQRRSGKKKIIPWQRYSAMAACLALILCGSLLFTRLYAAKGSAETPEMLMQDSVMGAAAQAAPRQEAEAEVSTFAAAEGPASNPHSHTPGKETGIGQKSGVWCGNMTAEIHWNGADYSLSGTDAVTLTELLYSLNYSEDPLCRCTAEFTVDTEMGSGYEISLSQYFVRYQGAQASLTEEQANHLNTILNELEE